MRRRDLQLDTVYTVDVPFLEQSKCVFVDLSTPRETKRRKRGEENRLAVKVSKTATYWGFAPHPHALGWKEYSRRRGFYAVFGLESESNETLLRRARHVAARLRVIGDNDFHVPDTDTRGVVAPREVLGIYNGENGDSSVQ